MSDTGANKAQQLKSSVNQSVLEKIDIKKEKPDDYTTWENRENQVPNADDADADDTKATPSTSKGRAEKQKVPIKKIRPMKVCIVDVLENNDIVLRKDVDETGGPTTTADGRVEIGVRVFGQAVNEKLIEVKQSEAVNGTTDNAGPPNKFVREGYRSGINQDSVGNKAAISGTKDRDNGATGAVEKEPETAVSIITPSDVNSSKSCPPTTEGNQSLLTDVEASSASVDKTEQSRLSKETDTQKSVTASQNQTPTENSSKQSSSGDAHKSHEKGEKSRLDLVSIAIVETSNISSIASTGVTQETMTELHDMEGNSGAPNRSAAGSMPPTKSTERVAARSDGNQQSTTMATGIKTTNQSIAVEPELTRVTTSNTLAAGEKEKQTPVLDSSASSGTENERSKVSAVQNSAGEKQGCLNGVDLQQINTRKQRRSVDSGSTEHPRKRSKVCSVTDNGPNTQEESVVSASGLQSSAQSATSDSMSTNESSRENFTSEQCSDTATSQETRQAVGEMNNSDSGLPNPPSSTDGSENEVPIIKMRTDIFEVDSDDDTSDRTLPEDVSDLMAEAIKKAKENVKTLERLASTCSLPNSSPSKKMDVFIEAKESVYKLYEYIETADIGIRVKYQDPESSDKKNAQLSKDDLAVEDVAGYFEVLLELNVLSKEPTLDEKLGGLVVLNMTRVVRLLGGFLVHGTKSPKKSEQVFNVVCQLLTKRTDLLKKYGDTRKMSYHLVSIWQAIRKTRRGVSYMEGAALDHANIGVKGFLERAKRFTEAHAKTKRAPEVPSSSAGCSTSAQPGSSGTQASMPAPTSLNNPTNVQVNGTRMTGPPTGNVVGGYIGPSTSVQQSQTHQHQFNTVNNYGQQQTASMNTQSHNAGANIVQQQPNVQYAPTTSQTCNMPSRQQQYMNLIRAQQLQMQAAMSQQQCRQNPQNAQPFHPRQPTAPTQLIQPPTNQTSIGQNSIQHQRFQQPGRNDQIRVSQNQVGILRQPPPQLQHARQSPNDSQNMQQFPNQAHSYMRISPNLVQTPEQSPNQTQHGTQHTVTSATQNQQQLRPNQAHAATSENSGRVGRSPPDMQQHRQYVSSLQTQYSVSSGQGQQQRNNASPTDQPCNLNTGVRLTPQQQYQQLLAMEQAALVRTMQSSNLQPAVNVQAGQQQHSQHLNMMLSQQHTIHHNMPGRQRQIINHLPQELTRGRISSHQQATNQQIPVQTPHISQAPTTQGFVNQMQTQSHIHPSQPQPIPTTYSQVHSTNASQTNHLGIGTTAQQLGRPSSQTSINSSRQNNPQSMSSNTATTRFQVTVPIHSRGTTMASTQRMPISFSGDIDSASISNPRTVSTTSTGYQPILRDMLQRPPPYTYLNDRSVASSGARNNTSSAPLPRGNVQPTIQNHPERRSSTEAGMSTNESAIVREIQSLIFYPDENGNPVFDGHYPEIQRDV